MSPREDNWWLGEEVTGTASEVRQQLLQEMRVGNIVRVSQQKGGSFQKEIHGNRLELMSKKKI